MAELKALAESKGYSLDELMDVSKDKKKKPVAAKYADPEHSERSWSGRGRKPKWLVTALESGRSIEDFTL